MFKLIFTLFLCFIGLGLNKLQANSLFQEQAFYKCNCSHWKKGIILQPTPRKAARTAILIIAPPTMGKSNVERRWKLGKKVWEQYMHTNPNVDCYFVQSACFRKDSLEQTWIEGDTIYVADSWYDKDRNDRLLNKTIKAMKLLLPYYSHFFRTNLNTFFNVNALNEYAETHHQSMFTTPLWEGQWYTIGYSILFTQDVAAHMCNEYERLDRAGEELISCYHADDAALTSLATGIWPYNNPHPFKCAPSLSFGVRQLMCENAYNAKRLARYGALLTRISSLEEIISYCEKACSDVILFRTRDDLSLTNLAKFYEYLLHKVYPQLPYVNLVQYLESTL